MATACGLVFAGRGHRTSRVVSPENRKQWCNPDEAIGCAEPCHREWRDSVFLCQLRHPQTAELSVVCTYLYDVFLKEHCAKRD
jgi:hypothetical protein